MCDSGFTPPTVTRPSPSAYTPSSQSQKTTKPDPYLVFRTLLAHSQSPPLHLNLAEKAEKQLSPAEMQVLLDLFGKMGMAVGYATGLLEDEEDYHCARCHKTYLERDNVNSACYIKHEVFNGEGERWGGDIFHYTCKSCGREGIEDGGGNGIDWPDNGMCYKGPHTVDPDDVDYDGDNICTCKSVGCPGHEEVHCVRCHETFVELTNVGYGCSIDHEKFNHDFERCGDAYRYTCNSCGQSGIKDGEGNIIKWPDMVCYEGKHMVNVEDVSYDDNNTLTCAAKGCPQGEEH